MKNFILKNKYFSFWIVFHSLIIISFLLSLIISPKISFKTSLFDILPANSDFYEINDADSLLADRTGRTITILVKASSFELAKSQAEKLYKICDEDKKSYDSLSLYIDSSSVSEISGWLHKNRFYLLDDQDRSLLQDGNCNQIALDALTSVYRAFSLVDLSYIEEDPFLLSQRALKRFFEKGALSSTSMFLKDDVLACEKDGAWFVLIRALLSEDGASLTGKENTIKKIMASCENLKKEFVNQNSENIDFIFSGIPFHSYENASSAQAQISIISTLALLLIVIVFYLIFRSFFPAILSAISVSFSCGIGFVSVLLVFREIHVLTFVFGTTLIGTCLDYSIHYFINWKANLLCNSPADVRNHIFRGVTLGFLSTEICFAALFFAPFPLLKQVSIFLFAGLAAAYLSVIGIYPFFKLPLIRANNLKFFSISKRTQHFINRYFIKACPLIMIFISFLIILWNFNSLKIENNIQELYSMSPEMMENEVTSAKVLNTGSSGWYFILKADTEEELLQKDEELSHFLEISANENKLGSFLSVSQFIPSEKSQKESYKACENLLPFVNGQYAALGFEEDLFDYEKKYDSLNNSLIHVSDSDLPSSIKDGISNLWIGKVNNSYFSCVMPLHVDKEEESYFRDYASNVDGVYFVNKVADISSQLNILSKSMLIMLSIAFVIVIFILFFCYRLKLIMKILSVPLSVTLVTIAVLLLCGIHLSFFPITALVLVFGLGLDYIIYAIEDKENKSKEEYGLNNFAIFLSFLTTALSFGALVFSTFPPVHMLGMTVFVGLTTAVITALTITKN